MTITEQDIKALTPQHRIVWHLPPGQPVEMGLYVGEGGYLCNDIGHFVRTGNGSALSGASRIVRIIPPAFVPRVGLFIGRPGVVLRRLVCFGDDEWLGYAPEISENGRWFTDADAHDLIENHDWEVMGDLSAPGEVTDAEVEAAARVLADYFGAGSGGWSVWASKARTALEAAREARND